MRIKPSEVHHVAHVQFGNTLNNVPLGTGLPDVEEMSGELSGYIDVLLGRVVSPVESPYLNLQEVATAYLGRALEMEKLIHDEERRGNVIRGSAYYRFRTGALRSFIDMAKRFADLGSRRLSEQQLLRDERYDIGEI